MNHSGRQTSRTAHHRPPAPVDGGSAGRLRSSVDRGGRMRHRGGTRGAHPTQGTMRRGRSARDGIQPLRRIRTVGTDAHRAGRLQGHERQQVHRGGDQRNIRILGGGLVRPHER